VVYAVITWCVGTQRIVGQTSHTPTSQLHIRDQSDRRTSLTQHFVASQSPLLLAARAHGLRGQIRHHLRVRCCGTLSSLAGRSNGCIDGFLRFHVHGMGGLRMILPSAHFQETQVSTSNMCHCPLRLCEDGPVVVQIALQGETATRWGNAGLGFAPPYFRKVGKC
jgi:hypothetical protein